MELFGGLPLPLSLAVLALIDGLSVGTLLIPVFLLLHPGRVRAGRIVLYLVTIAGFYLAVGLLFLWGLVNLADVASDFLASPAGMITRLLVGVALLITAFAMPTSKPAAVGDGERQPPRVSPWTGRPSASGRASAATPDPAPLFRAAASDPEPEPRWIGASSDSPVAATGSALERPESATTGHARPRPGRLLRWRERLLDPRTRGFAVMAVAIAAGLVEVATMLPYLVAMAMLADAGVDTPFRVLALVGYCALMIAPALVLLVLRLVAAPLVQRPLERFAAWMERTGAENTAWIIGVIGFLIARSAATELGLFDALGSIL
ncbi:GAP family protein [Microbacterium sufflavum]|uniref:GAP family protein n=1 Tax=Microbacterium sufflavum TaxID=2851649 RepID=A0ABY4IG47_9MICO|nr:GAP family protein [Microbacterium sufflavum]UPL10610.1 GAP family protein [Microbacterium sufflavum]